MNANLVTLARAGTRPSLFRGSVPLLLWLSTTAFGVAQPAATLQFMASSFGVAESAGAVILPVQRLNDATAVVSVDYATVDSSAKAGTNYTGTNGTLVFAAGETNKVIAVTILDDGLVGDGTRNFRVVLR